MLKLTNFLPNFLGGLCGLALATTMTPAAAADQSAVILLYHRFGEDTIPSTNIRLSQIEDHISQLKSGGYHLMSLAEVTRRLKNREALPSRTVAITVDDAYKSVADEGWPRLKAAGVPVTLFVSTDVVGSSSNYMTWNDVRRLAAEGVTIGHHSASHLHMPHSGLEASIADIRAASAVFKTELGSVPALFAYPYGEYTLPLRDAVIKEGFDAAFIQVSGPAAQWDDAFALPRFPVNENYGDMGRFKLVSQAMALPVTDIAPLEPQLSPEHNPPLFGFTLDPEITNHDTLACYPSNMGEAATLLEPIKNRIEVRMENPFPEGRSRINCTMPGPDGRWYWLGKYFWVPGGVLD